MEIELYTNSFLEALLVIMKWNWDISLQGYEKCIHTYMEILSLTEFACHIKKWMIMLILLEAIVPAKIVFSFLLLKIVM